MGSRHAGIKERGTSPRRTVRKSRKRFLRRPGGATTETPRAKFWKSRSTWPSPPMMHSDPFYRITYLTKEEIRKHKWMEGEKGRHSRGRRPGLNGPRRIETNREVPRRDLVVSEFGSHYALHEGSKSCYRGSLRSNWCRAINAVPQKSITYD